MKTSQTTFLVFIIPIVTIFTMSFHSAAFCTTPKVGGHTAVTGVTSCNGCHSGTPNSGSAIIDFDLGTNTYVPGQTYTGFVKIQHAGFDKFGFSPLVLKKSNNTTIGTFDLLETTKTRTYAYGNRNYVSHTPFGADILNSNSWSFTWTAPAVNVDTIKLYLGELVDNHNHATSGDFMYSRSITLVMPNINAISEADLQNELAIFPSPVSNSLKIKFSTRTPLVEYSIVALSGNVVVSKSVPV